MFLNSQESITQTQIPVVGEFNRI